MKGNVKTLGLLVAAMVCLGPWRSAEAQATKTTYQGLETLVSVVDPGRQWVTDGILHTRDLQQIYFDDADDARLRGEARITINANFHSAPLPVFGYGPMWGTYRLENEGGSWVGYWVGERTTEGHSIIRMVLKGEGGYKGLHASVDYVRMTPDRTVPGQFEGTITETPAK